MPEINDAPTNLVLAQLRQMQDEAQAFRAEVQAGFAQVQTDFKTVRSEISVILRQTIGEVYKANKTFAGFADLEARIEAIEQKLFA